MSTITRAIVVAACAAAIELHAQSQPPQAPATRPSAAASAASSARIIALGCISRDRSAAARLVLTDTRSDPPSVYRLDGDQATLALHVGHTVEITGSLSTTPGTARGTARSLKVQSLTWISTSCQQISAQK